MTFKVHAFDPEKAAARRERQYAKWCRRADVPLRFAEASIDSLKISTGVRAACDELVERMNANTAPFGRGIIFWGEPGRGKSTIAVALLRDILHRVDPRHLNCVEGYGPNQPGFYIPYPALIKTEKESWGRDEEVAEEAGALLRRLYCRAPVVDNVKALVLDDVGKEHAGATGFAANVLHDLLRSRYDDASPTIITTNLKPSEWGSLYGEATYSFIHEAFSLVKVGGDDRRL